MTLSKSAVIVGASHGVGAATARAFSALGFRVALIGRSAEALAGVAEHINRTGGEAELFAADVGDPGEIDRVHEEVVAWGGDPAVLLFNAASAVPIGATDEIDPSDLLSSLMVNVVAAQHFAHLIAPAQREADEGTLLFTGGGTALDPAGGGYAAVSAGKAGMRSIALTLAQDLAHTKIRVGTITLCGGIEAGGALDPERIAAHFIGLHDGTIQGPELVLRP